MSYQIITTNTELMIYCEKIQKTNYLSLDTEFIRTRTLYPQLGLLQIFDGKNLALVDPLNITDWQNLIEILNDNKIEKYFHACSEDIEVFTHYFGFVPSPILDSQILASFLDNLISSGYASLLKKYLNIEIDKSETRTNWLQRPLSIKQCEYAANDVLHLLPLITLLKSKVFDKGFLNAAYQETQLMVNKRSESINPDKAYLQIKNSWQLYPKQLGFLKKLASWRLNYAKQSNTALNFVLHEDILLRLAKIQPKSFAQLSELGMKGKEIRLFGEQILSILSEQVEEIPQIRKITAYSDYKEWMNIIKESTQKIAKETNLAPELLASKRNIEHFIKWKHGDSSKLPELLSGWRAEFFMPYLSSSSTIFN